MFREATESRLLVLGRDPDTDLLALLRAWYPKARFALERGQMSDWLGGLWHQPPSGLLVFADRLDPAEFQALGAWLQERPTLPVLAVMGNRGLFGVEPILGHTGLRLLPTPWTPQALRQVLGRPDQDSLTAPKTDVVHELSPEPESVAGESSPEPGSGNFAPGFLDGLIERVRDPLASLSGYLQLLQADQAEDALVRPALAAARELEGVLESLHLASESCRPHPSRQSGEQLAVQALKDAQRSGHEVDFQLDADFLVHVDPRLVQAALQTARVLLTRFGGGGALRLRSSSRAAQQVEICWDLVQADEVPAETQVQIPPFLCMLLERFAARVDAEMVLECAAGGVPRRAGVQWQVGASTPAR